MSKEAEEIMVLVCADADRKHPPFADNIFGQCQGEDCGREIMWRPYNSDGTYMKLCYRCAFALAANAKAGGEEVSVRGPTPQGKAELSERMSQKQLEDTMAGVRRLFGDDHG